jgi:predicted nucleic acid-binding protein
MLLDTSGFLCLLDDREQFHDLALEKYTAGRLRLTHSYVLAELVALAESRRFDRRKALTYVDDLLDDPDIECIWIGESLHNEAMQLLLDRLDKTYSLCDAVSFVLMRQREINDALTTDQHFEQEGFRRLLK